MNDMDDVGDAAAGEAGAQERYRALIRALCMRLELPDSEEVIRRRQVEVGGFSILLDHLPSDPEAMYLLFDYGIATAGRSLTLFRLMLESNLLVYAQDQAQLGLDPGTGSAQLIVRIPLEAEIDGAWLHETLLHYVEHGHYWRENLLCSPDEMYEGIGQGQYLWLSA